MTCQREALDHTLAVWIGNTQGIYSSADASLALAISQTDSALTSSLTGMSALSDALVNELHSKTETITTGNLSAIEDAQNANRAELDRIIADYTTSTNSIVTDLIEQISAANLSADSTRAVLAQDFASVLANLGSPDPSSRVGLLGKLRSTATITGNTAAMLETVTYTTQSQGNSYSSQLVEMRLQAAQFQVSQDRIRDLPVFPNVPDGTDVVTVFSFHISGQ
jgi:hypothetical protein